MKKTTILFDLDGTLLRSDKSISKRTLQALQKCREKGVFIGISTSRGAQNAAAFTEELQPEVLIVSGGALVKYQDKCIYKAAFSKEETKRIISAARRVAGAGCEITVDTESMHYWNYKTDPKEQDKSWGDSVYTDFAEFAESALKICVEIFEDGQAKLLQDELKDCDCVRFSDGYWYKFTPKMVTKENAIREVCAALSISPKEIIAFGDDYADRGMLELCGMGIAMGNAVEEVKKEADLVIGGNDEDGIAAYLEHSFLA